MFDAIAHRYDFLNHLLSFGIDKYWRKKAVELLDIKPGMKLIDIATGTCDLALEALKRKPKCIYGVDLSFNMLLLAKGKIESRSCHDSIQILSAAAEKLPFRDSSFDGGMVAFGVRNFIDLHEGLRNIYRVLKPGSRFVVLEFSKPRMFPIKQIFFLYFKSILPIIGRIFSKNEHAYHYLPESVIDFPEGETFKNILSENGFEHATSQTLTFGIVTLYSAEK